MIYSFRGADVSAAIKFVKQYNLTQINMGLNYRSTKTIVAAADSVVRHNLLRIEKEVFTENEQGTTVKLFEVWDEKQEAKKAVKIIRTCTSQGILSYDDIAILYRYRGQSRILEQELLKNNIPCKVVSGVPFFSRKVVKDMLAYVRLVVNPNDREAFRRVINVPNRKVGDASIKAIMDYLEKHDGVSIYEACHNVTFRQRATKLGVNNFLAIMGALSDIANMISEEDDDDATAAAVVREIYNLTNYSDYIKSSTDDDAQQAESDISSLINLARNYKDISDFVNAVLEHEVEQDEQEGIPTVKLLTMHGSKGLEWPVVIIVGCNEGTSPSYLALKDGNIEEERRLFFVSMTRARNLLFLTRAKEIMIQGRRQIARPSSFVKEIRSDLIQKL